MDEQARRQTTKGIWMSRAVEDTKPGPRAMGNNILVMDVEGTDGRERGEDQDFERKSALFALATSEVLVSFSSFYLLWGLADVPLRRFIVSRAYGENLISIY